MKYHINMSLEQSRDKLYGAQFVALVCAVMTFLNCAGCKFVSFDSFTHLASLSIGSQLQCQLANNANWQSGSDQHGSTTHGPKVCCQRWEVTKYIYSSNVLKYNFELLLLYLSTSMLCYFVLKLSYNSEVNYMYLIPLVTLQIWINNVKYNQLLNKT